MAAGSCARTWNPFLDETADDVDCRRLANVVGVRLEGQPEHAHRGVIDAGQRREQQVNSTLPLGAVDAVGGVQNGSGLTGGACDRCQGKHVLREAGAAPTEPGMQKSRADARVCTDDARDFIDICPTLPQIDATSFINEIRVASRAFAAYWASSAERLLQR